MKELVASLVKLPFAVSLFGLQQVKKVTGSIEDTVDVFIKDSQKALNNVLTALEDNMDADSKKSFGDVAKTVDRIRESIEDRIDLDKLKPSRIAKEAHKGVDKIVNQIDRVVPSKKEAVKKGQREPVSTEGK